MRDETRADVMKRLSFIEGHLQGIRRMVEADKYAIRRAIEKMEALMLEGHLHSCVAPGIRDGREDEVVGELVELYELANK
jgi:DNA-binding FrmR family transcriptional regulator